MSFCALLWQRASDVRAWAGTAPDARAGMFGVARWEVAQEEAAAGVEELGGAVRVLGALVRYPELVSAGDVSAACIAVSEWADANHLPETALQFAELAAFADPGSARAAAIAGTACARQAADDRATLWFERGMRIGRRTRDWEWYIRSLIRLGILLYEMGDFRRARRCYHRARSTALWSGHRVFAGKAHHDLLLIECATGTYESGEKHARRALALYPVYFARLPHLANDIAYLFTCHGCHADALEILEAALPLVSRPAERIAVLGTLAKAAAGMGNAMRYRAAVEDVLLLASLSDLNAAGALILAAEGAHLLQDWERAERLAVSTLEIAVRRREREPRERATRLLERVARREPAPGPATLPPAVQVTALKSALLLRLQNLNAPVGEAGAPSRDRIELTKFTMSGR